LRANEVGYALADPRLIEDWVEWDDGITNSIMTLFPCLNLQQSLNTVAIRQMVPRGPFESELFWTFLGFDDRMTGARPSSACGRAICSGRRGSFRSRTARSASSCKRRSAASASRPIIEMGGREVGPSPKTRTTETSVRGFWRTNRRFMNL
jgi:anthranilate 1,2-dioxygenase large subunit